MSRFKNEEDWKQAKFTYDFDRDGGTAGAIALVGEALPVGAYIRGFYAITKVAFASAGAATITVGHSTDADADSGATGTLAYTVFAEATPVLGHTNGASRTWDDTNDSYLMDKVAGVEGAPLMTVAAFDLTAGKAEFYYEYFIPNEEL